MSQKLTPELASKVLRADLKNIIDKVGAGKPLSGLERDQFDGLRLKTEDIGKKRQLSLLAKWTNGKRLNLQELSEIAELLPADAIPESEPESDVELCSERKKGRNGYFAKYSHYVTWYDSSLRTIKRWVEIGRQEKDGVIDQCPLDDPEELYAWLPRHVNRAVPAGVLKALIEWRKVHPERRAPSAEVSEEGGIPTPAPEKPVEPVDDRKLILDAPVSENEKGYAGALNRLEEMEVKLHRLAGQPGGAKPWLDTLARMGSVISKLREEKEKLGLLMPIDAVERILLELMQPVEQGIRGMYRTLCGVTGLLACPKTEQLWEKECDKLFERFGEEIFREVS